MLKASTLEYEEICNYTSKSDRSRYPKVYTNYGNFFAEYFIHLSNDVNDSTATITKQNVHGTSFDQYLSFSYHVTGIGSNITVSVNGSISGLLWNFNSTSLSIWGSATINISTLGVYQVLS